MMFGAGRGPRVPASNEPVSLLRGVSGPWARNVASTVGARVGVLVLGLGSTVALARGLGPGGRGVYALAMTIATVGLIIVNFGFHTTNTVLAASEPRTLSRLVSNSLAMASTCSVIGVAVLAGWWLLGFTTGPFSPLLLLLAICWLPVGIVFLQLQPLLLVMGGVRQFNLAEGGWQLASVALVMALWTTGRLTPVGAFAAVLAAFAAGSVYVVASLRRAWKPLALPSVGLLRRMLPTATRSWAIGITSIALVRLDVFIVASFLDTRAVGLYAVAVTICEAIMVVPATVGSLLLPKLAAMPDEESRWASMWRVLVVTVAGTACISILAGLLAKPAIRLIFGSEYGDAISVLYWLLPGVVLLAAHTVLIHHFLAIGTPPLVVGFQVIAVVLNLGLALLLLRPLGLAGAGVASTAAYGAVLAMTATYALRCRSRARAVLPARPHLVPS